jgi:hypothetical protein
VKRRRSSVGRSSASWARDNARIRQARQQPADVTVRYACPICGEQHDRVSHAAPGCFGLTDEQLQELRASAVDELVNAVRHDAPAEHIKDVIAVLDVVDTRLGIEA